MIVYDIVPHVGIGPVRLGMARDQVRLVVPGPFASFLKVTDAEWETDAFCDSGIQIFYRGLEPTVEYIEVSRDCGICALYRGVDVLALPADEAISLLCRDASFDVNNPELGYSYVFDSIDLALWRPMIPTTPVDPEGREFSTVGIGVPGYFRS